MSTTSHLSIPLVLSSQSQKEITVNEALVTLDAILNTGVVSRVVSAPPPSPDNGELYIIGPSPSGVWEDRENQVAYFQDSWRYITPQEGLEFWVNDEDKRYSFDGSNWVESVQLAEGDFQNLALLGVNATADSTNKLTVKSNAVLFATDSGNVQLKVNKPGSSDTASYLFQTGYSGRAEFGLIGDDDFQLKVSPDGSSFVQSMVIDKDNGNIDFKQDVHVTGALSGVGSNDLDDITLTSVATNDILVHSGSAWVNQAPATARSSLGLVIGTDVQAYDATISKTNTAETRSAAINMADNILQRPELKDYAETLVSASSGSSYTIDLEDGNNVEVTLTANCTFSFSNPPASGKGGSFTLILKQDGTGGRTVTWPAAVKWAGGTAPTLTTAANAVDVLAFITTDAGTKWYGFLSGADVK